MIYTNQIAEYKKYSIGDYTYGRPRVFDFNENAALEIGKFCSIAEDVTIFLGGEHRVDWATTYPFSAPEMNSDWPEAKSIKGHPGTKGNIKIGNDVWIGFGATIMSGVQIGDGAVIAAKTVVTKDVKAYTICGGISTKFLKSRFSEKQIEKLLQIQWWNWPIERIRQYLPLLLQDNITEFINKAYSN